jgi:hypothetical protein
MKFKDEASRKLFFRYAVPCSETLAKRGVITQKYQRSLVSSIVLNKKIPKDAEKIFKVASSMCEKTAKKLGKRYIDKEVVRRYFLFGHDKVVDRRYKIFKDFNPMLCRLYSGKVLVSGNDFYSSPRLNPDCSRLAWLTWNHPNMPWDGTELWVGALESDGSLGRAERVAGSVDESIFQPEWSPDGILHFVSDRTGWWNLYRWLDGRIELLCEMESDFGEPHWVFGLSHYDFVSAGHIVCAYAEQGIWRLAILDAATGRVEPVEVSYTEIWSLQIGRAHV